MVVVQRPLLEMGTAIASRDWRNVSVVACLGTVLVFTTLLAFSIWLQVVALQFEIRMLRGRVDLLERSNGFHIELKAFSEAGLHDESSKHPSEFENVNRLPEESTTTSRNRGGEKNSIVQENNHFKKSSSQVTRHRLKRFISDNRETSLQPFQENYNSRHNGTDTGTSPYSHSNSSVISHTRNETSVGTTGDTATKTTKRKHKEARYRKKHYRMESSVISPTTKYPATTEAAIISRPSRVMKTDTGVLDSMILNSAFRSRPVYEESGSSPLAVLRPFTKNRRRRPKHEVINGSLETLDEEVIGTTRSRQLVAAHYHGDTSGYTSAHEHYDGNGRLRHPDGIFRDWAAVTWMRTLGMNSHTSISENGVVTIQSSGLYFLYAQIYYVDEHDTNGFRLYVNHEAILHCTTHSSNVEHTVKANTCFTASLAYLNTNDHVSVSDVEGLRYSLFEPAKSFFGFFKVSDDK